jgi:hypothetical protein
MRRERERERLQRGIAQKVRDIHYETCTYTNY